MRISLRILLPAACLLAGLLSPVGASAVTSEQLKKVSLLDDLQRSDPSPGFSVSGMGAGKWSKTTSLGAAAATQGGAYNSGGRLGYGSPGGWAAAYWNAQEFKDNGSGVAVEATLTSSIPSAQGVAIWLDMPTPAGERAGYELFLEGETGSVGTASLYKWISGKPNPELLASEKAVTSAGTSYSLVSQEIEAGKSQISVWGSFGGGWANPPKYLVTDKSTPYTGGYAGLQVNGTTPSLDNFSAGTLPPAVPIISSSSPASPGLSTTPSIVGVAEVNAEVRLYTNSSCSGESIAKGSAAEFGSPGIKVSVAKESTTTFYATVTNNGGVSSPCSTTSVTYFQHNPPAAPTISSSNPASPANDNSPRILGSAPPETTVKLYTKSNCSGSAAASGTAEAFASSGLTVSTADNTTTTFYATATDAVGGVSVCSTSSLTYTEDSTNLLADAGFEGGTLNGWNYSGPNDATAPVVSAESRTGSFSAKFKLTGAQERSELTLGGNGTTSGEGTIRFSEGDDRYYSFSFKILSMVYGKPGGHNLIMQFKSEGEGSPAFGLQLWNTGGNKGLYTGGPAQEGEHFLTPVSENAWHDVVIHFVASAKGTGSYETYLDGTKIDSKTNVSMIVPGKKEAFIKNGIYRNPSTVSGTSEILIDNAKLGKTLASVGGLGHP